MQSCLLVPTLLQRLSCINLFLFDSENRKTNNRGYISVHIDVGYCGRQRILHVYVHKIVVQDFYNEIQRIHTEDGNIVITLYYSASFLSSSMA